MLAADVEPRYLLLLLLLKGRIAIAVDVAVAVYSVATVTKREISDILH